MLENERLALSVKEQKHSPKKKIGLFREWGSRARLHPWIALTVVRSPIAKAEQQ